MKLLFLLAIFSKGSAIIFECEYGTQNFTNIGAIYRCTTTLYSEVDNQVLTAVNGKHEEGKSNSDVKGVWIDLIEKNLDYIPKGLDKIFPNLIAINAYKGKISKLNGDELSDYKHLEFFSMRVNPIEYVPGNLFRNNPKMTTIWLYGNEIKYVGSDLLDGLDRLSYVDFRWNKCIHQIAWDASEIEALKKSLHKNCTVTEEYLRGLNVTVNSSTIPLAGSLFMLIILTTIMKYFN